MDDREVAVKPWAQVVLTVLLAVSAGVGSAMLTRSGDMQRVAVLEAQATYQREAVRIIDTRLIRIEDKLDRLIERRGR